MREAEVFFIFLSPSIPSGDVVSFSCFFLFCIAGDRVHLDGVQDILFLLHWDTICPFSGHNRTEEKNRPFPIRCSDISVGWGGPGKLGVGVLEVNIVVVIDQFTLALRWGWG